MSSGAICYASEGEIKIIGLGPVQNVGATVWRCKINI